MVLGSFNEFDSLYDEIYIYIYVRTNEQINNSTYIYIYINTYIYDHIHELRCIGIFVFGGSRAPASLHTAPRAHGAGNLGNNGKYYAAHEPETRVSFTVITIRDNRFLPSYHGEFSYLA